MDDTKYFRIEEVDGFLTFVQGIEWRDPWLVVLIFFHITITLTTLLTRNHGNFQIVLFLILLLLVYFSESLNELASNNWNLFSRQQYFDSKGIFISLVFSTPILLNCMVLVASWLYQSSQLMARLKRAQLQAKYGKLNRANNAEKKNKGSQILSTETPARTPLNEQPYVTENIIHKSFDSPLLDATGIDRAHFKHE